MFLYPVIKKEMTVKCTYSRIIAVAIAVLLVSGHSMVMSGEKNKGALLRFEARALADGADNSNATVMWNDGEHEVKMVTTNGKKFLTAKDSDGNVLYNGPFNTDGDREKVPPEILKKVENRKSLRKGRVTAGNIKPYRAGKGKSVKAGYLGISVSSASPALRKQLGLGGTGLTVNYITRGSPAAGAGVEQYDVLTKLDDQILINPEQFAVLVRMHKPGDTVELTLFRDRKEKTVEAVPGTKMISESELYSGSNPLARLLAPDRRIRNTGDNAKKRSTMIKELFSKMNIKGGIGSVQGNIIRTIPHTHTTDTVRNSNITWKDGDHTFVVETKNGKKHLTAKDTEDKVLFKGPVETQEEMEKVPQKIREKLETLNIWINRNNAVKRAEEKRDEQEKNEENEPIF